MVHQTGLSIIRRLEGIVALGTVVGVEIQDRGLVVIGASVVVMKHSLGRFEQVYFYDSLVNVDLVAEGGVHKPEVHEGVLEGKRLGLVLEQQVDLHTSFVIEYRLIVPFLAVVGHMVLCTLVDRGGIALAGARVLNRAGHSIVVIGGSGGRVLDNSIEETRLTIFIFCPTEEVKHC